MTKILPTSESSQAKPTSIETETPKDTETAKRGINFLLGSFVTKLKRQSFTGFCLAILRAFKEGANKALAFSGWIITKLTFSQFNKNAENEGNSSIQVELQNGKEQNALTIELQQIQKLRKQKKIEIDSIDESIQTDPLLPSSTQINDSYGEPSSFQESTSSFQESTINITPLQETDSLIDPFNPSSEIQIPSPDTSVVLPKPKKNITKQQSYGAAGNPEELKKVTERITRCNPVLPDEENKEISIPEALPLPQILSEDTITSSSTYLKVETPPTQLERKELPTDQTPPRLSNTLAGLSDSAKKLLSISLKFIRKYVEEDPEDNSDEDAVLITVTKKEVAEEEKAAVATSPHPSINKEAPPPPPQTNPKLIPSRAPSNLGTLITDQVLRKTKGPSKPKTLEEQTTSSNGENNNVATILFLKMQQIHLKITSPKKLPGDDQNNDKDFE